MLAGSIVTEIEGSRRGWRHGWRLKSTKVLGRGSEQTTDVPREMLTRWR